MLFSELLKDISAVAHRKGEVDGTGCHVGNKGAEWEPLGTPRQLEVELTELPAQGCPKGCKQHSQPL